MKILLKIIGGLLLTIIVGVVGTLIVARFSDGPLAIVAGGAFTTGEMQSGAEPDWSFVKDMATVEFQLMDPDRSRTTWIVEHDNRIFIPSGYMTTSWGKLWKQWPIEAEKDGRAILRVDGKLYERQLVRVTEGEILTPVLSELSRKYVGETIPIDAITSGYMWVFELTPRRS